MKTFLIAGRALLLLTLLFMPSIAVLMVVAFITGSTWWFGMVGLPTLLLNLGGILLRRQRERIWRWVGPVSARPRPS